MNNVLIIGYGNSLRGDDAIGIHAAHLLEDMLRDDAQVRVIGAHQLTPEMAEDVSVAKFVVFLDAAVGSSPGHISRAMVGAERTPSRYAHHCTPSALLLASEQLYGESPAAMIITMTGASFEVGRGLSPRIQHKMPELIQAVKEVIQGWRSLRAQEQLATVH